MAVRRPTAINTNNFPRGRDPMGSSCPALNEEVLLADNKWIPAKDLKIGDEVATHLGSNKVTHIDVLKDRVKKEVVFSDNNQEESIVTSDSHPYYVQNEEGFVEVKDLKVGDQVGNFKVKEIKDADKGSVVHISIDEAQTYYLKAGDKKVLSHNKRFLPPKKPTIEGMPISQLPIKTIGGMPMPFGPRPFDPMFDPPRNQPRPFPRKPKIRRDKKRGGFLGKAFQRLQEQLRKRRIERFSGMPRMPGMGSPGGRFNPGNIGGRINFGMEQMPAEIDISALERLPMGEQPMPPMPQDLPEVESVGMMPQMGMRDMQPRMMMQAGDEVSPEQEIFSLQAQLKNLEEQLRLDRSYNDDQAVINTSAEMAAIQKRIQEIMNGMPELAGGGDFPDLTGDGKVTQADILKGRGVYAEGDEVMMMQQNDMMAPGNQEIEASLMEVQGMQPDMQVLDQYVQMVTQMIQAGASEAEVIESLRQAGLDDDDIAAVFQAVMETMQNSMEQGGIDSELAQLG